MNEKRTFSFLVAARSERQLTFSNLELGVREQMTFMNCFLKHSPFGLSVGSANIHPFLSKSALMACVQLKLPFYPSCVLHLEHGVNRRRSTIPRLAQLRLECTEAPHELHHKVTLVGVPRLALQRPHHGDWRASPVLGAFK